MSMTMIPTDRYSRQSFLGSDSQQRIANAVVGVVGLGGGGSHIVQQLAHIGFQHYVLYDPDEVESSNLNRLVGATEADVQAALSKIAVAQRLIGGIQPQAGITAHPKKWQDEPVPLRCCDLIFGCLDGALNRRDLEAMARRYLIPYIDIGVDVHQAPDEPPLMAGQVALSMPGDLCLQCMGILNQQVLATEGRRYGDAGPNPQVIWANGVLASTAVGLAIDLLTDWSQQLRRSMYLEYVGNESIVRPSPRMRYAPEACMHYALIQVGDPDL